MKKTNYQINRFGSMKHLLLLLLTSLLLTGLSACGKKQEADTDSAADWQSQYDLGERYLSEEQYDAAIAAFTAAIEIDPRKGDAYLKLAEIYLTTAEPEKAVEILSKGLEVASKTSAILDKLKEIKSQYPDIKIAVLADPADALTPDGNSDPHSDAVITAMEESIPAQYDYAAPFREGFARVGRLPEADDNDSMKYFFINENGETISGEYDVALDFVDGLAIVGVLEPPDEYGYSYYYHYGFIDTTGAEVIPLTWRGDRGGVRPYYFYDGLAEVSWIGEDNNTIYTNLIDRNGNKQFPVDIVCEDWRGYGGGDEDPRILYLTSDFSAAADTWPLYCEWNSVQGARIHGGNIYPLMASDNTNTYWIDENWQIIRTQEGYMEDISIYSELEGYYLLYPSATDRTAGHLLDKEEHVLAENVNSAYAGLGDRLILSFETPPDPETGNYRYSRALYSSDGEALSEIYAEMGTWESGYIVRKENGQNGNRNTLYTVTDADLNELFSVEASYLCQESIGFGYEADKVPLFRRNREVPNSQNFSGTQTDYLDLSGQVLFPYEENTELRILTPDYVTRQRPDGIEIYDMDGHSITVIPGIQNLYRVWSVDENAQIYSYRTIEDVQSNIYEDTYAQMELRDGVPVFTEIVYNPYLGTIGATDGPSTLLDDGSSSLMGEVWTWDMDANTIPVTLMRGTEKITEKAALSLIANNLYKQGERIQEGAGEYGFAGAVDISLQTVDGSWQSEKYDAMGILSWNHISFCRDGKWGYLKAVQK